MDVLIPAFNAAHFLPGAIESVLAQTEPDWHLVIVDDGSTDNTQEVLAPYLDQLRGRITCVVQQNRGLPAARNAGIRASSSPLIALLDADDLWLPNRLKDSLPLFDDPQTGLTYGGIVRFRDPGIALDTFTGNDSSEEGECATNIYVRRIELPCPSVTFRRSCLDRVGMFDEHLRATEDRDLWLRIAQQFQVHAVPAVVAWYRMSGSSMSSDLPRMLAAQEQFIQKHYREPGCGWFPRRLALARVHKQQAESYADRRQFRQAIRHAWHAVSLAPWQMANTRTAASVTLRGLAGRRRPSKQ